MFRSNEEAEKLKESAFDFLLRKSGGWRKNSGLTVSPEDANRAEHALTVITDKFGPVITSYPEWHPIIALGRDKSICGGSETQTTPKFPQLDHTRYLANGLITCPYGNPDELIQTVKRSYSEQLKYLDSGEMRLNSKTGWLYMASNSIDLHAAYITDELIESLENGEYDYDGSDTISDVTDLIPLYADGAKPILIWWTWVYHPLEQDGTISPAIAVPLMLSRTLADLSYAQLAESWDNMRYLLLGSPHGARSSLLLNQLTVKQLRTMFNGLMASGAFGPSKR